MSSSPTNRPSNPSSSSLSNNSGGTGNRLAFDSINEPGSYICDWSGHLLRVPHSAISQGASPLMSINGRSAPTVTKISDDPYVSASKARMIAADLDQSVNF